MKNEVFRIKNEEFRIKNREFCRAVANLTVVSGGCYMGGGVKNASGWLVKNQEFCIECNEFCIENDDFCIENDDFCI